MRKIEYSGICYLNDVIAKAITVRLFSKSTWSNLGNGMFINQSSKKNEKKTIREIYPLIRTVCWNDQVIAKRPRSQGKLMFLEVPQKIQRN